MQQFQKRKLPIQFRRHLIIDFQSTKQFLYFKERKKLSFQYSYRFIGDTLWVRVFIIFFLFRFELASVVQERDYMKEVA